MSERGVLRILAPGQVAFWCPGCETEHTLQVQGSERPIWGFDGNFEAPTFTPSVLFRSGHFIPGQEGKLCWCTFEERMGRPLPRHVGCGICHSFVTDGQIQFLGDCTHALAGQTVPLRPFGETTPA